MPCTKAVSQIRSKKSARMERILKRRQQHGMPHDQVGCGSLDMSPVFFPTVPPVSKLWHVDEL